MTEIQLEPEAQAALVKATAKRQARHGRREEEQSAALAKVMRLAGQDTTRSDTAASPDPPQPAQREREGGPRLQNGKVLVGVRITPEARRTLAGLAREWYAQQSEVVEAAIMLLQELKEKGALRPEWKTQPVRQSLHRIKVSSGAAKVDSTHDG
jgi:hypothetical protein